MESNSTAFLIKIKLRHSLGRPSRSDFVQSDLSEETLEWLEWYNSIPQEKQLAVNSIPAELYTDDGAGTVDADQEK
ncbi:MULTISPECIES: hypothetical protein [Lachnospiraceae]|jgi:hypothetical protein|uniref:hypothetical protein n=1 Tax=Lachnospiraceae TaxID=186803 RepID=UPI0027D33042|nr:hypothetical protein [Agathobacter rectalis]MCB6952345.1 hypothetical protein [Agathobacter rectalis]MDU4958747.1 hypothetical protein [Agathobacter rectalis]